jgi:hypothetical protein
MTCTVACIAAGAAVALEAARPRAEAEGVVEATSLVPARAGTACVPNAGTDCLTKPDNDAWTLPVRNAAREW